MAVIPLPPPRPTPAGQSVSGRQGTPPSDAAAAARDLAAAAERVLPAASRGRARIIDAAHAAARAWDAIASSTSTTSTVGDDPRARLRRAVDASRRAAAQARRTARDVATMPDDALAHAWRVATAPAREARDAIASALRSAADRAERVATAAATTAAQSWGGAVSTIGGIGIVAILVGALWLMRRRT